MEVGLAVNIEGDQFAVELDVRRQRIFELRQERGHVPATPAAEDPAVGADQGSGSRPASARTAIPPATGPFSGAPEIGTTPAVIVDLAVRKNLTRLARDLAIGIQQAGRPSASDARRIRT
jgi:hypothetical protein